MPRSNQGPSGRTLAGGRAYYTGRNAYASQGFENDTRVSQLPALAILYLWGDQTIPGGSVDTAVQFAPSYASATLNPIFARGIYFNPNDFSLYCQATGTYRFTASIRAKNLAAATAVVMRVKVRRGNSERLFDQALVNMAAAATNDISVTLSGFIDLLPGDYVFLTGASSGGFTLSGGSVGTAPLGGIQEDLQPTYLFLEQIDLT